eukprot:CAMPEP_0197861760 /NCGR_PEP_ID=MMETSP1438-20131217/38018_1 /TAXON_ID=1461541 /ORGANISM="Pterosperma sp., Strain CCMP1384" /LENGTH=604 /DNA_ID=CAMNT_0043479047 /DNA_START=361 /DNA_END=2175 /DNA_ORIENTATION=+
MAATRCAVLCKADQMVLSRQCQTNIGKQFFTSRTYSSLPPRRVNHRHATRSSLIPKGTEQLRASRSGVRVSTGIHGIRLASYHRSSVNAFAAVSFPRRQSRVQAAGEEAANPSPTFEGIGLSDELVTALKEMRIRKPTEIQAVGIPEVMKGGNVLLASQTGSGKTLSYLLPMIQQLKEDELDKGIITKPKRPRALVLLPTRELADQVLSIAKMLSHHARFRCSAITGGGKRGTQCKKLGAANDLIVTTPGRFLQHVRGGNVHLGDVQYLVLDEADTMFEHGFYEDVHYILKVMKRLENSQCVMVAATLTKAAQRLVREELPDIRSINAKSLHRAVSGAKHKFLTVPGGEDKFEYLRMLLDQIEKKHARIMIFCNTLPSCRAVEHNLKEAGYQTYNYHGEMPRDVRAESMNAFMAPDSDPSSPSQGPKLLICTDIAARGLDFERAIGHVIQFDFPLNPVDYMHRSGRTARAGAKGEITSLIIKKDLVLAEQIHEQILKGGTLDGLSSNKKVVAAQKAEAQKKTLTKAQRIALKQEVQKMKLSPKVTKGMSKEQIKKLKEKLASKSTAVKRAYKKYAASVGPKPKGQRGRPTPAKGRNQKPQKGRR